MEHIISYIIVYLAAVSIISSAAAAWDKNAARKGRRRVPEKTLFLLAALGGSLAMYITMKSIRHKTKHKRFMIGLPLITALQTAVAVFAFLYAEGIIC